MNRQIVSDYLHQILLYLLVISWIAVFISFFFINVDLQEIGIEMGNWAIRFLWLSCIPGILKRFRVTGYLQNIQIVLMKSRRRIGDLMFVFALMHWLWNRTFFFIRIGSFPTPAQVPLFETLAFMGLFILIPLFLTSNNFSVRFLKKWWNRIHSLVYLSIWLIAFHVALQGLIVESVITFTIIVLQIASWIFYKKTLGKVNS